ncbi:nucleoside deaminase [Pontibacillus salicampi]|uniref:Nucleoside deaminase n=1 Tax=Pontibacillus salicampi TaxID=1449801 RepID=A0ABV6LKU4_9BACI
MVEIKAHRYFLQLAIEEGKKALYQGTYPVGAVIVNNKHEIISLGRNKVFEQKDATAHAEIDALRAAGSSILEAKESRESLTLYISLEPCVMCTGAILFANIRNVIWALNDGAGLGGFHKLKEHQVFKERFQNIHMEAEPILSLKQQQEKLLLEWAYHPNNVKNARRRNGGKIDT